MKTIFEFSRPAWWMAAWLCGSFLAISAGPAAGVPPSGFVRLVDAVAQGQDKLLLFIDGESMNPDGYGLGDVTGGIGLKPGPHEISLNRPGVSEGVTRLTLVAASGDKPAHWAMRILRLRQMEPATKRSATFVSVSHTPEHAVEIGSPNGKWNPVQVKRLATVQAPIVYPEGYVPLRCKSRQLPAIPVGEPGNYLVVLYDDAAGNLQALNLQDHKYLSAE